MNGISQVYIYTPAQQNNTMHGAKPTTRSYWLNILPRSSPKILPRSSLKILPRSSPLRGIHWKSPAVLTPFPPSNLSPASPSTHFVLHLKGWLKCYGGNSDALLGQKKAEPRDGWDNKGWMRPPQLPPYPPALINIPLCPTRSWPLMGVNEAQHGFFPFHSEFSLFYFGNYF